MTNISPLWKTAKVGQCFAEMQRLTDAVELALKSKETSQDEKSLLVTHIKINWHELVEDLADG